jgi:hypothetical protein
MTYSLLEERPIHTAYEIKNTYNYRDDPDPTEDWYFDPKEPIIGERKVNQNVVSKRRAANKRARKARRN